MKKTEEQRGEVFDSILNLWLYIERIKKIIVNEFRGEPRLLFSSNLNYILQTELLVFIFLSRGFHLDLRWVLLSNV